MSLLQVDDALARILRRAKPLASETSTLVNSHGRVLARKIVAVRDQPPFDASAMDGYALRYEDLAASPRFTVVGTSAAGHAYKGKLRARQAIRILTGAPLPKAADTIVIQENTVRDGNTLVVSAVTPKGKNIRPRGLDFKRGDLLIPAGTRLNSRDIGLAAAGNTPKVSVHRRPRITLFTTGDELVLPGQKPRPDQIVSSNSHALEAMFRHWGANVNNFGIVRDRLKETEKAINKGLESDILITTGGASVGDHDFVRQAFKNCGIKIGFWRIALRPGKPLMFGTKRNCRVLGLPGNPVSALVCARVFIKPLINILLGLPAQDEHALARLASPLPENDSRQDYIRATLSRSSDGTWIAQPYTLQDSSMQRTLRESGCLIIRKPHAPEALAGETVKILVLDF